MTYSRYYWLNENSRKFLSRGYIDSNSSAEERIIEIAESAERILGIGGFASKFEDYMSRGFYSLSTPVWCNFGKDKQLAISCYGSDVQDSMDSILNAGREIGMMSKYGGGTSMYLGRVRPRGADISVGGKSDGPTHYARIYDAIIDTTKQGSSRRGACAIYLDVEHDDILEFLNIGTEGNPIQNLQYGVCVGDDWLKSMIEGDVHKRKIWAKVIQRRSEFGFPYIFFRDNVNNNSPYKESGMEITHTNLCITGDQRVVTSLGYLTAKELNELDVELELFDGEGVVRASKMKLRGRQEKVYKITYANGMTQKVTANHGIPVLDGRNNISRVECKDLKVGDKVAIQTKKGLFGAKSMEDEAFLLGLYQSDGTQHKDTVMIDVWENDFDILDEVQEKFNKIHYKYGCDRYEITNQFGAKLYREIEPPKFIDCVVAQSDVKKKRLASKTLKKALNFEKGYVPSWIWESNEKTQWEYIRGLLIADGTVNDCNSYGAGCQLSYTDINRDFLQELQMLFTNLGLTSKIYLLRKAGKSLLPDGKGGEKYYSSKSCWRLVISNKNDLLEVEKNTGFLSRKGNPVEDRIYRDNTKKRTRVVSIEYVGKEDVYCPTVYSDEHIFVSQGVKTFNCSEICLPNDSEHSFVCCLGSINLLHWDELKNTDAIETYIQFLNAVMDHFIDQAGNLPGMGRAYRFAKKHRALGLGVLGYHSYLQSNLIPFESLQAKSKNKEIFKTIQARAEEESKRLYKFKPSYVSPRKGFANATLMAIAPTKSSSYILGQVSMGIEPIKSNYFVKDLAKVKETYRNPFLEKELEKYELNTPEVWSGILERDGSVAHLNFPTKDVFKSFIEISPAEIILQAAQRQQFIDQSQSLNLMIHPSTPAKDINKLYLSAWEQGIKTLYYQFSQSAAQSYARNILECNACEA